MPIWCSTKIYKVALDDNHNKQRIQSTIKVPSDRGPSMCTVLIQLICQNVRRNKKVYAKCKSGKIPDVDSAIRNRL